MCATVHRFRGNVPTFSSHIPVRTTNSNDKLCLLSLTMFLFLNANELYSFFSMWTRQDDSTSSQHALIRCQDQTASTIKLTKYYRSWLLPFVTVSGDFTTSWTCHDSQVAATIALSRPFGDDHSGTTGSRRP